VDFQAFSNEQFRNQGNWLLHSALKSASRKVELVFHDH